MGLNDELARGQAGKAAIMIEIISANQPPSTHSYLYIHMFRPINNSWGEVSVAIIMRIVQGQSSAGR